jgi:hypothetical protein
VKIEFDVEFTTILNNDSNKNSLLQATFCRIPLHNSILLDSLERTLVLNSKAPLDSNYEHFVSVVDSLKKLHASEGSRNAFKKLKYSTLIM